MKKKLALALLFSFLIVVPYAFASDTDATVQVQVDPSSKQMAITGHLPSGAGQEATIIVLNPAGGIDFVDQTTVASDGSYLFRYTLNASAFGEYTVTVGGQGVEPVSVKHLYQSGNGDGGNTGGGNTGGESEPAGETPTVESNRIHAAAKVTDGRADIEITNDLFNRALQSGAPNNGNDVVIAVETDGGDADVIEVILPAEPFKAQSAGVIRIQIALPFATITITTDVMDIPPAEAQHVILTVGRAGTASLPADIAAKVKGELVFDFQLSVDRQPVDSFKGSRSMHIALPYTLQPGENANTVIAVYISDAGDYEIVKNAKYDETAGLLSFYAKHFSKYAVSVVDVSFDDLASAVWASDSVHGLTARGVVAGNGRGQFEPLRNVTRAEFVKMLVHSFDLLDANAEGEFSDVSRSDWYYAEVMSASQLGIVQGYPDGMFRADRAITREEMIVMAARALAAAGIELEPAKAPVKFADEDRIAAYASDEVLRFNQAGIVEGDELGRFSPRQNSSRAAAAKVVYLLLLLQ